MRLVRNVTKEEGEAMIDMATKVSALCQGVDRGTVLSVLVQLAVQYVDEAPDITQEVLACRVEAMFGILAIISDGLKAGDRSGLVESLMSIVRAGDRMRMINALLHSLVLSTLNGRDINQAKGQEFATEIADILGRIDRAAAAIVAVGGAS